MMNKIIFFVFVTVLEIAQREGTPQYEQKREVESETLRIKIGSSREAPNPFLNRYRISEPKLDEYVIALAVNPCGTNSSISGKAEALGYDCCDERSPVLEYEWLKPEALDASSLRYLEYRVGKSDFRVEASPDEIGNNVDIVDLHGNPIKRENSLRPDDSVVIDESCVEERVPHFNCIGPRTRAIKMRITIPCSDNNKTVSSTSYCIDPNEKIQEHCMQVGYSQNTFIFSCGGDFENDNECGTFLEIHKPIGSFYDDENIVIAEKRLSQPFTNGMKTTTIPLTYNGDPSKLLCSVRESKIRIGSMVLITDKAPSCCCPRKFSYQTMRGSFMCPMKPRTKHGPFADAFDTIREHLERTQSFNSYPVCPDIQDNEDDLFCSLNILDDSPELSSNLLLAPGRFYSMPCEALKFDEIKNKFSSTDLDKEYDSTCDYGEAFQSCASLYGGGRCGGNDSLFSFIGEVGKVTEIIDQNLSSKTYSVTFNDGRTSYFFDEESIELITPKSNFEIWWVQRTRFERIIQHKKPFRVAWPPCTFDPVNDDYFPYTQLDDDGNILNTYNIF